MAKGCISKKDDLGIPKNYWGINFTFIADKVYNALLLNRIKPKIAKILGKNFGEINPQHNSLWQFVESSKEFVQKISKQHYCL